MGGLPSQAWADAINALYDAGVVVVTAAGNNFGNAPTHVVVYPARFGRVIAACGVMANGAPYANLPFETDGRQLRPGRQNADGDCGLHAECALGAVRRADRRGFRRQRHLRQRRPRWPQRRRCGSTSIAPNTTPIEKAGCASRRCGRRCSKAPPRATPLSRRNSAPACSAPPTRSRFARRQLRNWLRRPPTPPASRF